MSDRCFHVAHRENFADPKEAIEKLSRRAWQMVVERLELRRIMSVQRWNEMDHHFDHEKLPPFTEENVNAFARTQSTIARDMLDEMVCEVFEWLRPHKGTQAGNLKTNTEMEIGERVILNHVITRDFMGKPQVSSYRRQHLIALENVLNGLDGNGEICKGYNSLLRTAIEAAETWQGETALFSFRACHNGNLHLRCKRLDLLAKFNARAGGLRLRPAKAA